MPRTANVEQRRADILDAALEVFAEKGYHATSIADIAAKLQIGHGTFYRYFKNKLDIFECVLEGIIDDVAQVVQDEPPTTNSVAEYEAQLRRIGRGLFEVFIERLPKGHIVFYESFGADLQMREKIMGAMDLFARFTEQYMKNGVEKGFLRAELDTEIAARGINAVIFEGVKRVIHAEDPEKEAERWIVTGIGLLLTGLVGE